MSGFGRMASFFHAKHPQERRVTLNINLDLEGKGAGKTATVEFMVNRWGRVRLLNEDAIPEEIRKKYGNTLLAAVVAVTGWEVVHTKQGERLRSPNGIVEYEFLISLKDGRTGIPFRLKPFSGKREYGDLRNYIVSSYLEGATISIKINSVNCELKNSELKATTRKVRHFDIYNLDGSQTLVYKTEQQPAMEKAIYREYESYRKLFIVKHLLPGKANVPRFTYSTFDAPERMPWLPSMLPKASTKEPGGHEAAFPQMSKANTGIFGTGFEVIADVLPEESQGFKLFEDALPRETKGDLPREKCLPDIENTPIMLESRGFQANAGQLPMKSAVLPANQQEIGIGAQAKSIRGEENREQRAVPEKNVKRHAGIDNEIGGSRRKGAKKKAPAKPVPFSALSSFKAVIFDLDGVIVDSELVHPRTFERALAKYGVKIDNAHWKRAYTGIGSYAIFDDIVKKYGIKEDARELVKKRNEIYLQEIQRNRLPVIAGFAEVHRQLLQNGVKEAVASGGHINHVEESLRSAGLRNVPFVAIEHVKRGKPAPEIFLKAAKRLRVKPSECVVFEDSLSGVEAAARAGMPCVALSTTMQKKELRARAALVVNDYRSKKLKKLLAVLLDKRKDAPKARRRIAVRKIAKRRK